MMNRRRWVFAGAATVICAAAGLYFGIGRPAPPPVLNYSIEAQKSAADQPYYASPSDTFEGGWKFRLHLQPPPSGFLYVVNQGPGQNGTERFWILYSAPVKPRQDVVTGWYVFDQNPGTERLWMVWEPQPAAELNRTGEVKDSAAAARIRDILSELQPETGKPGKATGLATLLELRHR
jgi:hypothetical protein